MPSLLLDLENCPLPSKEGKSRGRCDLIEVNYSEDRNYNLFSLARMLQDERSIHRNAKATKMKKKGRTCVFSFKTDTQIGADDARTDDAYCLLEMELDATRAAAACPPGTQIEC